MASSPAVAVPRAQSRSKLLTVLDREGLIISVVAVYVAGVTYRLPWRIGQDAWLALLGGRQVVGHGPPGPDHLTYWTAGKNWIDQQWLAQAVSYGLYNVGGLKLFALTHVALVACALGLAAVGARLRGASSRAVCWLAIVVLYLLALDAGHVRAQSFAYPLFSLVLLLLLADVRRPSRHVFFVVPILAVWANVHGSVVLGAALVALHGILLVRRSGCAKAQRAKGGLLVIASAFVLIATPWGTGTLGYYRATLFNSAFKTVISEWRPPTLSLALAPLFVLAALGLWLLGRSYRRFTTFETLSSVLLMGLAFAAQRNIVWFALAAIPLLSPALDDVLPSQARPMRMQANVWLALGSTAFATFVLFGAAVRPERSYRALWPAPAADAVARAAAVHPRDRIYGNEQFADWLLMTHPELTGRIAYDIRFELLSAEQLAAVAAWRNRTGGRWQRAADGADIIVLALPSERRTEQDLLLVQGTRTVYRDRRIAVLLRPAAAQ